MASQRNIWATKIRHITLFLFLGSLAGAQADDCDRKLRSVWENSYSRVRTIRFIKEGIFQSNPELARGFILKLLKSVKQNDLSDSMIYAQLADFILKNANRSLQAMQRDNRDRILRRAAQIKSLVASSPKAYLDIGSGEGGVAAELAKGWDLPPSRAFGIDVAKYEPRPEITHLQYDRDKIPLRTDSVDVATLLMVLHHTENPVAVLKEINRVLEPKGTLIVRETDAQNGREKLFNTVLDTLYYEVFDNKPDVPIPKNYRSAKEWVATFAEAGFTVEYTTRLEPNNPFSPVYFVLRPTEVK